MARKDPDAPLTLSEQWAVDVVHPITLDVITQRLSDGETLKAVCKSRGWPKSYVWKWINDHTDRRKAYDDALQAWADELAQETLEIADGLVTEPHEVGNKKVRIDTRFRLAKSWDRQRYGDTPAVNINAQGGSLIQILQALPPLGAPEEREPEVIEGVVVREQKVSVVPMELRDKTQKTEDDGQI